MAQVGANTSQFFAHKTVYIVFITKRERNMRGEEAFKNRAFDSHLKLSRLWSHVSARSAKLEAAQQQQQTSSTPRRATVRYRA